MTFWCFAIEAFLRRKAGEDRGGLEIASFQFEEERFPEQDVKGLTCLLGRHLGVAIVRGAP